METNKYIYINENSISRELCKDIINLFEVEEGRYIGKTRNGVDKDVKDTTDYLINPEDKKWTKIHSFLKTELNNNLKSYLKTSLLTKIFHYSFIVLLYLTKVLKNKIK